MVVQGFVSDSLVHTVQNAAPAPKRSSIIVIAAPHQRREVNLCRYENQNDNKIATNSIATPPCPSTLVLVKAYQTSPKLSIRINTTI
jgi:hypothetical protein